MNSIKVKQLDKILALVVAITASQAHVIWIQRLGYRDLYLIANSTHGRPSAYRVLIPFLSRVAEGITGIDIVYCMSGLVVLSAIGLFYSLRYLYSSFAPSERADIVAFLGCEITFLLILWEMHIYDLATVMFFALALALLANNKFWIYYLIFPLATLNRETTFLLLSFFVVYFYKTSPRRQWMYGTIYQVFIYILIRWITTSVFANLPGEEYWWTWPQVPLAYIRNYPWALILLVAVGGVLYFVFRGWYRKPLFLRTAFLIIFPLQVIMHFTVGLPWELRVYAESASVILCLAFYSEIAFTTENTEVRLQVTE